MHNINQIPKVKVEASDAIPWGTFVNENMRSACETFLAHIIKLLNIFCHIVDEISPSVPPSKTKIHNLPTAANNLSPLKNKRSDIDKGKLTVTMKLTEKDDKSERKADGVKANSVGHFAATPNYVKLYDILRVAFQNYKVMVFLIHRV